MHMTFLWHSIRIKPIKQTSITMKTLLTDSAKELINKFDKQLAAILKEDVVKFRQSRFRNFIDYSTQKYDIELQEILRADLEKYQDKSFAQVG